MTRPQRLWTTVAVLPVLVAFAVGLAACGSSSTGSSGGSSASPSAGQGLGSSYDVSKAGNVTLKVLWLGDQEAPGLQKWMDWVISQYEAKYPNVKVETILGTTSTYQTQQVTLGRSKKGPDIWYNWPGIWSLQPAWNGFTVPNETVMSTDDINRSVDTLTTSWNHKTWQLPLFRNTFPLCYNKALFKKAGLDPEKPPTTWDEFVADLKALKAHGIIGLEASTKMGTYGYEEIVNPLQVQVVPSMKSFVEMSALTTFNTPEWKLWLTKLQEIAPYFDPANANIDMFQCLARFGTGKAAMMFGFPGWQGPIKQLGADGAICKPPVFGTSTLAGNVQCDTPGWQVTSWSKIPLVAGNFVAFTTTGEAADKLWEYTNVPPDSREWNGQVDPGWQQQLVTMLNDAQGKTRCPWDYYPTAVDANGNGVAVGAIINGRMTVDEAAAQYQKATLTWRKASPQDVSFFKTWLVTGDFAQ